MSIGASARLRAAALLLLVAGFGFSAGILADRLVLSRFAVAAEPGHDSWPPGAVRVLTGPRDPQAPPQGVRLFRLGLPEQLVDELDLSAEQRAEIERILAEDQAALREVMEQFEPSLTAIIEESRQKIFQVLTEEQAAGWRESRVLIRGQDDAMRRD